MYNSNIVYIISKIRQVCVLYQYLSGQWAIFICTRYINFCLCVLFLQAVRESVQASTDDSVLKCLIDLADTCPKLLRANLEPILDLMLEVQCVVLNVVVKYFILSFIG